jgi:AMP deaminase
MALRCKYQQHAHAAPDGQQRCCSSSSELRESLQLKFVAGVAPLQPASPGPGRLQDGEPGAEGATALPPSYFDVPSVGEVYRDVERIEAIRSAGPVHSHSYARLQLLEVQFNLHEMLNSEAEMQEIGANPHRDFYNVRKVDTHIHHSAAANAKHLLRFIKKKAKKCGHEVVHSEKDNSGVERALTLTQVFEKLKLKPYDLNIDRLAVMADSSVQHRFDKFNVSFCFAVSIPVHLMQCHLQMKYNPCGESLLRTIFLKHDNYIEGRYMAELTRELFADLEETKYQLVEYRLSIYGRKRSEWSKLVSECSPGSSVAACTHRCCQVLSRG